MRILDFSVFYFIWWSTNNCMIWYFLLHMGIIIIVLFSHLCIARNAIVEIASLYIIKCCKPLCSWLLTQCNMVSRGFKMFVIYNAFNLPLFMHAKTIRPSVLFCLHYATFPWHQFERSWYCSQQLWGQQIQLEPWTRQHHASVRLFDGFQATAAVVPTEVHWTSIMTYLIDTFTIISNLKCSNKR